MAMEALRNLYVEQIRDMHSACTQSLGMTGRLAEAATNADLRAALEDGVAGIERGIDMMEELAEAQGADPAESVSRGMAGLVAEAQSEVFDTSYDDPDTRDAAIVVQYQKMAHYAIAGYGTIRSFAHRLGLAGERDAAQHCLDKSYDGDRRMTDIATGEVNPAAA